ncbi:hypothetical protein Lepto7376_1869 [[Leptolyngbya] sp. PCC 7376]|uniref:hypothetical protein n=1 Tax=[Leptolyngbya] sp. PCC 7376 TaxID=111781 RepID=UPI00029F1EF6|nr:hypothetical protein [[Leptolyngbya] sp. PCC 7376]AFY38189.1 hypothetical protein Lepto7376_1869 [[Leptolyngbya] sp. PCC 7376]
MALFGLFGGKTEQQQGDFFLDFEEAQTLGDTEYMKQSKTIKRTFPKLKGNEGKTIISQVSSDNMREVDPNQTPSRSNSSASFASSTPSFASATPSFSSSFTPAQPAAPEEKAPMVAETAVPEPVAETKQETLAPVPSFTAPPAPQQKTDTSMDMFRNMAKNIRK